MGVEPCFEFCIEVVVGVVDDAGDEEVVFCFGIGLVCLIAYLSAYLRAFLFIPLFTEC